MNCAAERGGKAITISHESTSMVQTNIGILVSVMPGQRIQIVVAITLMALASVPMPETKTPRIH